MRLPTRFETNTADITGSDGMSPSDYPESDGTPTFAQSNGVPHYGSYTWTSTASTNSANNYWVWNASDSTGLQAGYSQSNISVRCVLP